MLNEPEEIVIDFKESRVVDHSSIEVMNKVTELYRKLGKKLHLRHLSKDCKLLLDNASEIIDVNYWKDPNYKVTEDGGINSTLPTALIIQLRRDLLTFSKFL